MMSSYVEFCGASLWHFCEDPKMFRRIRSRKRSAFFPVNDHKIMSSKKRSSFDNSDQVNFARQARRRSHESAMAFTGSNDTKKPRRSHNDHHRQNNSFFAMSCDANHICLRRFDPPTSNDTYRTIKLNANMFDTKQEMCIGLMEYIGETDVTMQAIQTIVNEQFQKKLDFKINADGSMNTLEAEQAARAKEEADAKQKAAKEKAEEAVATKRAASKKKASNS